MEGVKEWDNTNIRCCLHTCTLRKNVPVMKCVKSLNIAKNHLLFVFQGVREFGRGLEFQHIALPHQWRTKWSSNMQSTHTRMRLRAMHACMWWVEPHFDDCCKLFHINRLRLHQFLDHGLHCSLPVATSGWHRGKLRGQAQIKLFQVHTGPRRGWHWSAGP